MEIMMYKENEELILLGDVGKEGDKGFIPKGTKVTFIEAFDQGLKSYVAVQYGDRILTLSELAVTPSETNALAVLKDFNSKLMADSPELKKYHHNLFMRLIYRIRDFFRNLLTKKKPEAKVTEEEIKSLKDRLNLNEGWEDFE
jgi:hypothetical protein